MTPIPLRRHLLFWLLVCAATGWDLYSKETVFKSLGGPGNQSAWEMRFFGGVTFEYFAVLNHGALWGVGQGFAFVFALLSVVAVAVIVYWLFVKRHAHSLWLTVCLALIMGGTLGNLYDRLGMHGIRNALGELQYAVRDFLHFNLWGFEWAIFNYADVFLVTGAIMLALHSFFLTEDEIAAVPEPAKVKDTKDADTGIRAAS